MAFNRPTLKDLVARIVADFEVRMPGADARLRRSNLNVFARVLAGATHGLYGFLGFIAEQVLPTTASGWWLERWASIWGITRKPAVQSVGPVIFAGTDGVVLPIGIEVQRSDGAAFVTTAEGRITNGVASVPVSAVVAGVAGNTDAGSRLLVAAQILGVQAYATVGDDGLQGGVQTESDDALRNRLLFRLRNPPHGGALHDYEAWALEVAGVTRAWVKPAWMGLGTVGVFFVCDDQPDPIPSPVQVEAVRAHVESQRPVTAEVFVLAPVPWPVPMTIALTPDTASVREAVAAELADLFRRQAEPGGTILHSHMREAISLAAGEVDHRLDVPDGNVTAPPGHMPLLGAITWTA